MKNILEFKPPSGGGCGFPQQHFSTLRERRMRQNIRFTALMTSQKHNLKKMKKETCRIPEVILPLICTSLYLKKGRVSIRPMALHHVSKGELYVPER